MSKQLLFCFANSPLHAHQVVDWLRQEGISTQDISACVPDKSITFTRSELEVGGEAGCSRQITVLGKRLCRSAKTVTRNFNSNGSLASVLVAKGISAPVARRCEIEVQGGGILISVHAASANKLSRAREILKLAGTRDVAELASDCSAWFEAERSAA